MRKCFTTALVALSLFAILSSCSKDEQAPFNPVKSSSILQDDYVDRGNGEIYYPNEKLTTYVYVKPKYLLLKPLSLEKYQNDALLDSVCNKDIALVFKNKGRKTYDKSVKWGSKPFVVEEYAPIVTFNVDTALTIKFSKMVTAFGLEFTSPYKGLKYGITVRFFNSKIKRAIPQEGTRYLGSLLGYNTTFGAPNSAVLSAIESETPFDEVIIEIETGFGNDPPLNGPLAISVGGFRYKLAN